MTEQNSRTTRKQTTTSAKKKKSILKTMLLMTLLFCVLGLTGAGVAFAIVVKNAPPLNEALLKDSLASTIYDKDGKQLMTLGHENRTFVPYKNIPKVLEDAVLAVEDSRFYEHKGFDIIRFGGAVLSNITRGYGSEGGSTITQQLAKNAFLTNEKTPTRKIQELWLSFQMEKKYTKQQILEMYLNKIFYSTGPAGSKAIYGVGTAANVYFGKTDLRDLTLPEAAMLAGLPQSPTRFNPFKHPEAAENRRNIVLSLMITNNFITDSEAESAKNVSVTSMLTKKKQTTNTDVTYDSFIDQIASEVEKKANLDIFASGLKIYTTIDPDAQKYVNTLMNSDKLISKKKPLFQSGIALLDTKTGEIRALGGGRNKEGIERGFNYAIDTRRQPGSAIKPILDYGPAVNYLKWSTYHKIVDEPYAYSDGTPIKNSDSKHLGAITIRTALAKSRNIPAIKTLQAVGMDRAKQFANNLGLELDKMYESYAVGGLDKGVSPLQMAGAYSAFGNEGIYNTPHAVDKIIFPDDKEISLSPIPKVTMKDYTAFMITDMLKTVVQSGTGTAVNIPGLHIAGKTGTTNFDGKIRDKYHFTKADVPDSWFVGYTPNYTAAVWTGFSKLSDTSYLSKDEQRISKNLFKELLSHVDHKKEDFKQPNSVIKIAMVKGTNPPVRATGTSKSGVIYEYAVKGTEEEVVEEKTPELETLSPISNLQGKYDKETKSISLTWDYEKKAPTDSTLPAPTETISFEVKQFKDEVEINSVVTTTEKSITIPNIEVGGIYKFEVHVVRAEDSARSTAQSISVDLTAEKPPEVTPSTENPNGGTNGEGDGTTPIDNGDTSNGENSGSTGTDNNSTDENTPTKPTDSNTPSTGSGTTKPPDDSSSVTTPTAPTTPGVTKPTAPIKPSN